MNPKPRQNLDLKQQALKEFELKDVKELLNKLKSGDFQIDENSVKNLDKDDDNLSETEKILYEQSQEVLDTINFLESIVLELEKKEKEKETSIPQKKELKSFGSTEYGTKLKQELNDLTGANPEQQKEKIKTINKIENITKNYNSLNELLNGSEQAKIDRRKILEIDYPDSSTCPPIKFKNENIYRPGLGMLKEKIATKENQKLANKLKGVLPEEYIKNNILKGECKAENLTNKLKETNKFTDDEIQEIIGGIALSKKTLATIYLRNTLAEKNLKINDIKEKIQKGKTKEINELLKQNGFNKEEIEKIIEKSKIVLQTEEAIKKLEDAKKILMYGEEGYNLMSNEYFKKNPFDIVHITDKQKFKDVIKLFPKITQNFSTVANPEFKNDINLILWFSKQTGKKLNYEDINEIDFNELNNENKIKLLESLGEDTLNIYLLEHQEEIFKLNNPKFNKQLNGILNNNEISENIIEETDPIIKDNTIIQLLEENPKKGKQVLELLNLNYTELSQFPKTLNYVKHTPKLINYFIKKDPNTYFLLNKEQQNSTKHSLAFVDSVLKGKKQNLQILASVEFSDIKSFVLIYNKIEKNNPEIIDNLLGNRYFINKILNLKDDDGLRKSNSKKFNEILKRIGKMGEKQKRYEENYNKTVGKHIEKNKEKINTYKEKFKNGIWNKKILDYVTKLGSNFQSDFAGIINTTIEGNIKSKQTYIEKLSKMPENKYIEALKVIEKRIIEVQKKLEEESTNLLSKDYKNKEIFRKLGLFLGDKFNTEKFKRLFSERLKQKQRELKKQGKNLPEEQINQIVLNEILGKSKISQKTRNELNSIIKGLYIKRRIKSTTKTYANKTAYKILNSGDQKAITKLHQEYEKNYEKSLDNDIKEYTKSEKEAIKNYEKNNNINLKANSQNNDSQQQNSTIESNNYSYTPGEKNIEITNKNGIKQEIKITPSEMLLINQTPEVLENIVNFYETLDRLGLTKLWEIKENLFKSIANVNGISFQIDHDYLNENEIKIFLNSILKSVGQKEINFGMNLESFLGRIEVINKTQAMGGNEKIVNTFYGETFLENEFKNKFYNRNGSFLLFNQQLFEDSLKGKKEFYGQN